jgi:hypothetical protein
MRQGEEKNEFEEIIRTKTVTNESAAETKKRKLTDSQGKITSRKKFSQLKATFKTRSIETEEALKKGLPEHTDDTDTEEEAVIKVINAGPLFTTSVEFPHLRRNTMIHLKQAGFQVDQEMDQDGEDTVIRVCWRSTDLANLQTKFNLSLYCENVEAGDTVL